MRNEYNDQSEASSQISQEAQKRDRDSRVEMEGADNILKMVGINK